MPRIKRRRLSPRKAGLSLTADVGELMKKMLWIALIPVVLIFAWYLAGFRYYGNTVDKRLVEQSFRDLLDAAHFYELQAAGLGGQFLDNIDEALESIRTSPQRYPIIQNDVRRCLIISKGRDFKTYAEPKCKIDASQHAWLITFMGMVIPSPGNYFTVVVDVATGKAVLIPGE